MPGFRFFRTGRTPIKASAKAVGISVGVHAAVVATLVIGVAGHSLAKSRASRPQPGIVGNESQEATSGVGSVAAPAVGPSLSPELGAQFVGRYQWPSSAQEARFAEVRLINDGETVHWSLAVIEGQGPLRTLNAIAQDTFAFQLAPAQRVVFRRVGDSVTSISIRRGRDTSWAARVTAP
jgi:hypothetical protein